MTEPDGSGPLRVLVVDDEPPARRILLALLRDEADMEVVGACGNGEDAIRALHEEEVDLVFLDVQMPEVGGFDVLAAIDDEALPLVVFVTAYDEHAIRAFEVGAIDYLLKPFDDERFRATLARVRERAAGTYRRAWRQDLRRLVERAGRLEGMTTEPADGPTEPADGPTEPAEVTATRIPVRTGSRVVFVDLAEVDWIEAQNYYVRLHVGDRSHLLRETLTRLETRLDPAEFVRVHRSAIVRIERVKELRVKDGRRHEIVLENGTIVAVSRTRRSQVMRALGLRAGRDFGEDEPG